MIRTTKKTKLSESVTSHRLEIGPEKLDSRETLESRINRHLDLARSKNTSIPQRRFKRSRSIATKREVVALTK